MIHLLTCQILAAPLLVIEHTVEIDEPAQVTWDVLTAWDAYAEWNPWVIEAAEIGPRVDVTVILDDTTMDARHRVILVDEPDRYCWEDMGAFTIVAKGQRCRTITTTATGSTLTTELILKGPLKGMADRRYGDAMRSGVRAESDALKGRAEGG
ncbi:MAG: hypothetical protein GY913_02915 [Proteobacteria bacterium]|nr:hypothetical protein [Pseudomonadota bacterium]MCP4915850.1 hypothetical protein [Pseudomonadota bacterium]